MNEKQLKIQERNQALVDRFRQLDELGADASPLDWEILAGHYFEAGFLLNASTCFMRADAIKDARLKQPVGVWRNRNQAARDVAAPWDNAQMELV